MRVPCPDCLGLNRKAMRRCKKLGGMCDGKGWVYKRGATIEEAEAEWQAPEREQIAAAFEAAMKDERLEDD